jgi:uncharacterized protein YndB with AHSA1/START domain
MNVVRRRTSASPAAVFAVLADGWRYADWVVGAKTIRHVDDGWPAVGARFHHKVGVGPVEIRDSSVCEAVDADRGISLRVKAFPAGSARVRIMLEPTDDGGAEILLEEHPLEGFVRRFDNPLQRAALRVRNVESLRRLARLAEKGVRQSG